VGEHSPIVITAPSRFVIVSASSTQASPPGTIIAYQSPISSGPA
jgi:hypothetical protein